MFTDIVQHWKSGVGRARVCVANLQTRRLVDKKLLSPTMSRIWQIVHSSCVSDAFCNRFARLTSSLILLVTYGNDSSVFVDFEAFEHLDCSTDRSCARWGSSVTPWIDACFLSFQDDEPPKSTAEGMTESLTG